MNSSSNFFYFKNPLCARKLKAIQFQTVFPNLLDLAQRAFQSKRSFITQSHCNNPHFPEDESWSRNRKDSFEKARMTGMRPGRQCGEGGGFKPEMAARQQGVKLSNGQKEARGQSYS